MRLHVFPWLTDGRSADRADIPTVSSLGHHHPDLNNGVRWLIFTEEPAARSLTGLRRP
jgi:hypothetical protein